VLCLPDCTGSNLNQKSECGASLMWHKEPAAHIVSAMKLGLSVPLPRALPRPADLPPGSQNPETTSVTCMDGWRPGQNGGGFPYCFFDTVHWPQARLDLSSVAVKVVESDGPLAPDALVIHIRSGDSVMQVNDWLTRDATEEDFPEGTGITCAPLQPGCKFFVDAALTGLDGGPFAKVYLLADTKCHGELDPDGKCPSINPCIRILMDALEPGVVEMAPAGMSNAKAFERDVHLMMRAQNFANTCSTFSVWGRLTSKYLRRLFAPQCQLHYEFTQYQTDHGRRRNVAIHPSNPKYFFHNAWSFLGQDRHSKVHGHSFSSHEQGVNTTWYEFLWSESPVILAALGTKVLAMTEWENLTNSPHGRPITELLTNVGINKTIFSGEEDG